MWRERINNYNRLVRKGHKQVDIARMWGVKASTLSSRLRVTAKILKMKVETTYHLEAEQPYVAPIRNEHGQGWGIKNCTCEPCGKARNLRRREVNRRYRANKKKRAQQQVGPS